MRMQPCDTNPPIVLGALVPWIAYSPPDIHAAERLGGRHGVALVANSASIDVRF
jgi:hypothetical protein